MGRQLFLTKGSRIGYTIRGVKPGDKVCLFDGAPCPHVLRSAREGDNVVEKWRFVGDAYVHGLMNGEADGIDIDKKDIVLV